MWAIATGVESAIKRNPNFDIIRNRTSLEYFNTGYNPFTGYLLNELKDIQFEGVTVSDNSLYLQICLDFALLITIVHTYPY